MPTQERFYLHDATTSVSGTLPSSATLSSTASSVSVTGSGTNRTMNDTIGASQVSQAWTTLANQNAQPTFVRRYLSEPLGVNSFGTGGLANAALFGGLQQSNTNSRFAPTFKLWIWRPSTGDIVATLRDSNGDSSPPSSTAEQWRGFTSAISSGTSSDGDVLVMEFWRGQTTQLMSTAYTDTFYYDGTVVTSLTTSGASTSDAASLLYFYSSEGTPVAVEMSSGAPPPSNPPYRNPMPPLLAQ